MRPTPLSLTVSPTAGPFYVELIPRHTVTGRPPPGHLERSLLGLPARLGDLGISSPTSLCDEYDHSKAISSPLVSQINSQHLMLDSTTFSDQLSAKSKVKSSKKKGRQTPQIL